MKRLPILLLGLVVLGLGSCDLFNTLALHGSWEYSESGLTYAWTFYPGNTMEWKTSSGNGNVTLDGTYEVSGDKLSMEIDYDGDKQKYDWNFEIQGDELKIWTDESDGNTTFKRK